VIDLSRAVETASRRAWDHSFSEEYPKWDKAQEDEKQVFREDIEALLRWGLADLVAALADEAFEKYRNAEVRMARYEADDLSAVQAYLYKRAEDLRDG
jgi:hypothetical protein